MNQLTKILNAIEYYFGFSGKDVEGSSEIIDSFFPQKYLKLNLFWDDPIPVFANGRNSNFDLLNSHPISSRIRTIVYPPKFEPWLVFVTSLSLRQSWSVFVQRALVTYMVVYK